MALLTPICAYAELTSDEEARVRELINNIADFKQKDNNATTFASGTTIGGGTSNSVAFAGGTVANEEKAVAWGGGTAYREKSTAWGENTKAMGQRSTAWGEKTLARGERSTAWGYDTEAGGDFSTAWGRETLASGNYSTTWGMRTYAGGLPNTDITEGTLGEKFQSAAQLCNAIGTGRSSVCTGKPSLMEVYDWYINTFGGSEEDFREAVGFIGDKGVAGRKGENATAFGKDTIAGNDQATAFGEKSIANGENSTAFGKNSFAYADNSLAALGGQVGLEGKNNTGYADNGKNSVAIGVEAFVESDDAYAVGRKARITETESRGSVALGGLEANNTEITKASNAFATTGGKIGENANNSIAMGLNSSVGNSATNAFAAIGGQVADNAVNAIAVGSSAKADIKNTIAIGTGAHANTTTATSDYPAIAIGQNASAIKDRTIAIGQDSKAQSNGSVVIGYNAQSGTDDGLSNSVAIGQNATSTALETVAIGGASANGGQNPITQATDKGAIAIGGRAQATANQAIAIGQHANTTKKDVNSNNSARVAETPGEQSIAIGAETLSTGIAAIAIGGDDVRSTNLSEIDTTYADGSNFDLLQDISKINNGGNQTTASGNVSIAMGSMSKAQGNFSNAFGFGAQTGADHSIAMGTGAYTGDSAANSIAVGYMNKVTGSNSIAIGQENVVLADNMQVIGDPNLFQSNNGGISGNNNTGSAYNSRIVGSDNVIGETDLLQDKYKLGSEYHDIFVIGNNINMTNSEGSNSVYLGSNSAYVAVGNSTAGITKYETNAEDIKSIDEDGNEIGVAIKAGSLKFAGAGSDTDNNGVVSVGAAGKERRIQNVAAGLIDADSTDAINGSQLYSVVQNLKSSAPETTEIKAEEGVAILPEPYTYQDKDGNPLTLTDASGSPYTGSATQNPDGTFVDVDGNPLTLTNKDGSTYDSTNNPVTTIDNGNKFVTASDVRDTINNVYWSVDATGNGDNSVAAQNVKAGNKVELIGGDGVSINQINVSENETKFAFNVNVDNQTTRIKYVNTSGNEVAQDSSSGKWYPVGDDGNPDTSATEVQAGDVTSQVVAKTTPLTMEEVADSTSGSTTPTGKVNVLPSESGLATATDVANAINSSGWKVSGSNSDAVVAVTDKANGASELINPGDSVAFVAGKGLNLGQKTQDGTTTFTFNANVADVTINDEGEVTNITYYDGDTNTYKSAAIAQGDDTNTKTVVTVNNKNEDDNKNLTLTSNTSSDDQHTYDIALSNNVTLGDDTEAGSLNVSNQTQKDGDGNPIPVANTEIKPNEINFTDGGDDNTGTITGLKNHLADGSSATSNPNSGDLSSVQNQAATVGDVLNAGWDLQANGEAIDFITHGDTVNFASSDNSVSISGSLNNGVSTIDLTVATSKIEAGDDGKAKLGDVITYQDADGNPLIKDDGGNYTYTDGSPYTGDTNNITSTSTPVDGNKVVTANDVVNTINNSGWKVSGNNSDTAATGTANGTAELINPGDNVAFVAGKGLKLDQTTQDGTTTFTFSADVTDTNTVTTVTNGDNNVKVENIGTTDAPNYAVSLNNILNIGNKDNGDKPITIDGTTGDITLGGDTGGNINNVANHINPDGTMVDDTANTNQAASVQDVLNSGWNVKVGNADPEYIKHGDQVAFVDGQGTQVTGNKDGIAYDIKVDNNSPLSINGDNALTVNVSGFNRTSDGSVQANNSDGLVTAGDVATAVNNSGWVLTTSASGGTVSGTSRELIRPSNTMTLDAGDNIAIIQSGSKVRIATTRNINVAGDLNVAGNTNVHNLNVAPNSNVDMGGNQIHNVAPGTADTDAVNVSQLREATGTGPSVKQDIQNMGDQVRRESNAGTAQAMAVAGLPQAYLPGKNMVALGGSVYRGESGYAVGFSTISDNGSWIFKATGSGNSRGHYGGTVSGGFQW